MDSFRCIHAARLLLDQQLHGLPSSVAGQLTSADRKIIEDATLLAFEQIVEQAVARDVHCVLLSGNGFDPDDHGLRGPATLVRGIARLAEHDIAVILQAGRPDLWSSWPAGLRFPPNTHRLGANLATSVSIAREGELLATIALDEFVQNSSSGMTTESEPKTEHRGWQIHLLAVHPLGMGQTTGTIHIHDECSPAQGLRPDEIGPHGFTLIEIKGAGEPSYTFVPAAPVRWENFSIDVSAETSRDDLLQEMASRLEQTRRETCEKVWLVAWEFTGAGPNWEQFCEQLENDRFRGELLHDLSELDPAPGVRIYTHALRTQSAAPVPQPVPNSDAGSDQQGFAKDLAAEFAMRLEARFAGPSPAIETRQAVEKCLSGSMFDGGPWEARITSLSAELNAGEIAGDARRLATRWFAGHRIDSQVGDAQGE